MDKIEQIVEVTYLHDLLLETSNKRYSSILTSNRSR